MSKSHPVRTRSGAGQVYPVGNEGAVAHPPSRQIGQLTRCPGSLSTNSVPKNVVCPVAVSGLIRFTTSSESGLFSLVPKPLSVMTR